VRGWTALGQAASAQAVLPTGSEPGQWFFQLLSAVLAAGKAHVAAASGGRPLHAGGGGGGGAATAGSREATGWAGSTGRVVPGAGDGVRRGPAVGEGGRRAAGRRQQDAPQAAARDEGAEERRCEAPAVGRPQDARREVAPGAPPGGGAAWAGWSGRITGQRRQNRPRKTCKNPRKTGAVGRFGRFGRSEQQDILPAGIATLDPACCRRGRAPSAGVERCLPWPPLYLVVNRPNRPKAPEMLKKGRCLLAVRGRLAE
jgi:hypothetical protein